MAQFDVFENSNSGSADRVPYLLDLQADLFDELATRVVAPLIPVEEFGTPATRLNPVVTVSGKTLIVSVSELAGISSSVLRTKAGSLAEHRSEIVAALDFLFIGS